MSVFDTAASDRLVYGCKNRLYFNLFNATTGAPADGSLSWGASDATLSKDGGTAANVGASVAYDSNRKKHYIDLDGTQSTCTSDATLVFAPAGYLARSIVLSSKFKGLVHRGTISSSTVNGCTLSTAIPRAYEGQLAVVFLNPSASAPFGYEAAFVDEVYCTVSSTTCTYVSAMTAAPANGSVFLIYVAAPKDVPLSDVTVGATGVVNSLASGAQTQVGTAAGGAVLADPTKKLVTNASGAVDVNSLDADTLTAIQGAVETAGGKVDVTNARLTGFLTNTSGALTAGGTTAVQSAAQGGAAAALTAAGHVGVEATASKYFDAVYPAAYPGTGTVKFYTDSSRVTLLSTHTLDYDAAGRVIRRVVT